MSCTFSRPSQAERQALIVIGVVGLASLHQRSSDLCCFCCSYSTFPDLITTEEDFIHWKNALLQKWNLPRKWEETDGDRVGRGWSRPCRLSRALSNVTVRSKLMRLTVWHFMPATVAGPSGEGIALLTVEKLEELFLFLGIVNVGNGKLDGMFRTYFILCLSPDDNAGALRWFRNGDDNPHWIFTISLTHPCWQAWNLPSCMKAVETHFLERKCLKFHFGLGSNSHRHAIVRQNGIVGGQVAKASCHSGLGCDYFFPTEMVEPDNLDLSFHISWRRLKNGCHVIDQPKSH